MRKIRTLSLAILIIAIGIIASFLLWYHNRPLPEVITDQMLFKGVSYTREIERHPVPLISHIVKIDLTTTGLKPLVTPADDVDSYVYAARTTSDFLDEFNVQLAINGDFFDPQHDFSPLDYYPHSGDGVNTYGLSVSQSIVLTEGYAAPKSYASLYITPDNKFSFEPPEGEIAQAISGNTMLVTHGQPTLEDEGQSYLITRQPRTAVALNQARDTLIIVIVDGRQLNYSEGATISELTEMLIQHGAYEALNLDGGGSTALVIEGVDGHPVVLNSPIHTRLPGRERPVANHLGFYLHASGVSN